MIKIFAVLLLSLSTSAFAADVPKPLDSLAGCYKASYRFVEDGIHDTTIVGEFYEYVSFQAVPEGFVFQHYGQQGTDVIKHWSETWSMSADLFKQVVVDPFGKPRYECNGKFQFNQFSCSVKNAPKPVRDSQRTDYKTLDREIVLQITPKGWVQAQNDTKRDAAGVAVSNEVGWNQYDRVDDKVCAPAIAFAIEDQK
jgi:hypothetical protein